MNAELLERVDGWAGQNEVACLYFLADGGDAPAAHAAEEGGFRLMDVRVELRREPERIDVDGVREARPGDSESLRAIARASHGVTRFYADPQFPDERCHDLYDIWISRSLEGWAEGVLVAEHDGRAAGYVSCHLDGERSSIGLIAVDETARGAGLGVALARAAVDWAAAHGSSTMSVVTQGRNVQALRTFERAGFRVDSLGLWFHKWYDR
jgi:dTDP-4-amino-4,6-dideoxy-D-galactose acyltransferase